MSAPARPAWAALAALAALALAPAAARAGPVPVVELFTMEAGDDVFSRFGHAALCVTDERDPRGRCYNYGTTDFSTPVPLTWNVLRGRALFWVSVVDRDRMIHLYGAGLERRTVFRQVLPLSPDAAARLVARLDRDTLPENRFYTYHHFFDNCTTRLRDHVDAVTAGALHRGADAPYGPSFRDLARWGFASSPGLLTASEVLLGRATDARPSVWQAMFLPRVLRVEVTRRLGATPETVFRRDRPVPAENPGLGRALLAALAVALGAALTPALASSSRAARRVALAVGGGLLGLVGVVLAFVAAVSTLPELRWNELLLVFLPTDFVLVALEGRWLRRYLFARLALAAVVALGALAGVLAQPLAAPLLVALALLAPAAWMARRRGGR